MNKKIYLLLSLVFIFVFQTFAYATLQVTVDPASINLGSFNLNDDTRDLPRDRTIRVICTTDQGNPWELKINLESLLANLDNPSAVIPETNFWWYGFRTNGTGSLVTTDQDFSLERVVYTSSPLEGNGEVIVEVKFRIKIPNSTQSGNYGTRVLFTIVETA